MSVYEYVKSRIEQGKATSNWQILGKGSTIEAVWCLFLSDQNYDVEICEFKHSSYIFGKPKKYKHKNNESVCLNQMCLFSEEETSKESFFEKFMAENLWKHEVKNPKF